MDIIEEITRNVEGKVREGMEWGDAEYVRAKARAIVIAQLTDLVVKGYWD